MEGALTPENQGWVENKLRFDCGPHRGGGEFVLRMPMSSHCTFIFSLSMEIVEALRNLPPQGHRQRAKLAQVLSKIDYSSTSDVSFQFKKSYDKKSPNSSFAFSGCKYSCQQMCRQSRREKMELRSVIYGWAIWWSIYTTVAALLPVLSDVIRFSTSHRTSHRTSRLTHA